MYYWVWRWQAASLADDCVIPDAPQILDLREATLEQMFATQKSVKEFQAVITSPT